MPMVDILGEDLTIRGNIAEYQFDYFIKGATTAEQAATNMQNQAELYLNE